MIMLIYAIFLPVMLSIYGEAFQSGDIVYVVATTRLNCFLDSNERGEVYCMNSNGGNYQKWKYIQKNRYSFFLENVATGLRLDNAEYAKKRAKNIHKPF